MAIDGNNMEDGKNNLPQNNTHATHEVAGLDNEKDSLLMQKIKAAVEQTEEHSKDETPKADNKKAEETGVKKQTSKVLNEMERRKKNFKDWSGQHK